jgi:hypothetical protein
LASGENSTLFRPDLWLFFALKIKRLTSTDLSDCEKYLAYTIKTGELFSREEVLDLLTEQRRVYRKSKDETKLSRIEKLISAV